MGGTGGVGGGNGGTGGDPVKPLIKLTTESKAAPEEGITWAPPSLTTAGLTNLAAAAVVKSLVMT